MQQNKKKKSLSLDLPLVPYYNSEYIVSSQLIFFLQRKLRSSDSCCFQHLPNQLMAHPHLPPDAVLGLWSWPSVWHQVPAAYRSPFLALCPALFSFQRPACLQSSLCHEMGHLVSFLEALWHVWNVVSSVSVHKGQSRSHWSSDWELSVSECVKWALVCCMFLGLLPSWPYKSQKACFPLWQLGGMWIFEW